MFRNLFFISRTDTMKLLLNIGDSNVQYMVKFDFKIRILAIHPLYNKFLVCLSIASYNDNCSLYMIIKFSGQYYETWTYVMFSFFSVQRDNTKQYLGCDMTKPTMWLCA